MNVRLAPLLLMTLFVAMRASGQGLDRSQGAVEVTDSTSNTTPPTLPAKGEPPKNSVGRKAAERYMGQGAGQKQTSESNDREVASSRDAHYLAVHLGGFVSDNAYKWGGPDVQSNIGSWNFGVTYRVGEWVNSMDLGIRVDIASFGLSEGRANKIGFLPVIMFPDATSKFPLYFGGGIGLGVFQKQISNESSISLDYQLFAGVRFFDLFRNTGFFVEAGLKNHFLLLSDGQFNGTFAAVGAVFTF